MKCKEYIAAAKIAINHFLSMIDDSSRKIERAELNDSVNLVLYSLRVKIS